MNHFKLNLFIMGLLFLFFCGCELEKNNDSLYFTISKNAFLRHSLGISGDQEGATIIQQAKNHAVSDLLRNATTNWEIIYEYRPLPDFIGEEEVVIEVCTGNGIVCDQFEEVRLLISVVN